MCPRCSDDTPCPASSGLQCATASHSRSTASRPTNLQPPGRRNNQAPTHPNLASHLPTHPNPASRVQRHSWQYSVCPTHQPHA